VRLDIMVRVPTHLAPPHPGEILVEDFLEPFGLTQVAFAERIGVSFQRVNGIANGRRSVTPDTALRFAKVLGTSPDFWLNLQQMWDLYRAMHSPEAERIAQLEPITP
jgi:addiction module HigA family antidote